jgi:superfamily I DNA/RNA helicase
MTDVVHHDEGPARLVGGFGTGKTTALRERSARLRAAGARVLELRPPDMAAFAVDVLARAGVARRLLTRAEQEEIVRSLVPDDEVRLATEIAGTLRAYEASFLGAEELFVHAEAAGALDRAEALHALTETYLARLDAMGAVDEAGALVQASLLLRDDAVLQRERARFDFLAVDDFQLATYAVNRLVMQLAGQRGNVVVAGHAAASIGSEDGVDAKYLDAFVRRFDGAADHVLDRPSFRRPATRTVDRVPETEAVVLDRAGAVEAVGKEWPIVVLAGGTWRSPPPVHEWFDRALFAGPDVLDDDDRAAWWYDEEARRFAVASTRATHELIVVVTDADTSG